MNGVEILALFTVAGLAAVGGVVAVREHHNRTWQQELVAYVLKFPRGLDPKAVIAFLEGLSGIVAPKHVRPFVTRAVTVEASADPAGIEHRLVVPRSLAHVVTSALRAAMPSVSATPAEDAESHSPVLAAELGISDHGRALATDHAEAISTAILASLQPLERGERVVVQWCLSPLGPRPVATGTELRPTGSVLHRLWTGRLEAEPDGESVKAARGQARRAAVRRHHTDRGDGQRRPRPVATTADAAAFHTANAPGVHLRRLARSSSWVARALAGYELPLLAWPCTLNAAELAGLLAFPLGEVALPGLNLGGCRQLAPAADIPSRGRVVAEATFPGAERPLALSVPDSLRHLHVIGPTGSGKSTLLVGLIAQDMAAGHGVLVIEPSSDLVNDVLDRVPTHRLEDVVLLDPVDELRPVGLNLLSASETDRELVTEQVVGTLHNLYHASWGPRTDDILRSAILTLVGVPGMTLAEVTLLLTRRGLSPAVGRPPR